MNTLGAPPHNEPAWSIVSLAEQIRGVTATRVYDTVIELVRDHGIAAAYRIDIDPPPRTFAVPDFNGADYQLDDAYLTDQAAQRVLSRYRDGVVIPGRAS